MQNVTANANMSQLLDKYHQDVAAGGMNEDKYTWLRGSICDK
jgi:hypothetical protein